MFGERLQPTGVAKVVESSDHLTLVVSAGNGIRSRLIGPCGPEK
jgi:hypothetical protein